jgi:hypothetical protein
MQKHNITQHNARATTTTRERSRATRDGRNVKATVKVRDYAKRKKDLLQAVIDIFDECRHTEKLANERLRVLLKQQSK